MAAPEPTLRLTATLTAAGGVAVALVAANADRLRIGAMNHTFGPWQITGVVLGLMTMLVALVIGSRRFRNRYPDVVQAAERRPQLSWMVPRVLVIVLAVVVIVMAGRGLESATCPESPDPRFGTDRPVVASVAVGDTLVCEYDGGL
ncbi:MAG: hypothetical protein QNJ88_12175 [Acidimicrobiia bacterium]|nr:hypothetical protein [Acidimicrobiia bacterium]